MMEELGCNPYCFFVKNICKVGAASFYEELVIAFLKYQKKF